VRETQERCEGCGRFVEYCSLLADEQQNECICQDCWDRRYVNLPTFDTVEDAQAWMMEQVDDPCVDNDRFAFEDDAEACQVYADQVMRGCCGSFDEVVLVSGKRANIGCNYGH
jgi:hypothetical protein